MDELLERIATLESELESGKERSSTMDEFLTPDRVPLEKAYEMVMRGEIKDGKTIAGILKLKALLNEGKL